MVLNPAKWSIVVGAGVLLVILGGSAARWGPAPARDGGEAHHLSADADYLGTALDETDAPRFRLVDQTGQTRELTKFQGKAVALTFLDPRCTDSCPLTAFHFRQAVERLGDRAGSIAFVGINVNKETASVDDVAEATRKWGNSDMSNWHFLTGTEQELRPVWDAFHVVARGGSKADRPQEQAHTPGVFVLDASGRKRWYVSIPLHGVEWSGPSLSEVLAARLNQLIDEAR